MELVAETIIMLRLSRNAVSPPSQSTQTSESAGESLLRVPTS